MPAIYANNHEKINILTYANNHEKGFCINILAHNLLEKSHPNPKEDSSRSYPYETKRGINIYRPGPA